MAADLSDDLLHNIFLRLSIKSLLRCKFVCKAWNRILCEPEFIRMHFNYTSRQHPHKLLIRIPGNNFYSVDYEEAISSNADGVDAVKIYFPPKAFSLLPQFLGSCNGLVCIAIEHDKFDLDIPLNGGEFKLCSDTHRDGIEVNGFIYWMIVHAGSNAVFSNYLILGFCLRDEKFTVLPIPQDKHQGYPGDLMVLGGCLAMFKLDVDGLVVWTMKETKKRKKWDRLITLPIHTSSLKPVYFMKNGKVLLRFPSQRGGKKMFVVYDPHKKCVEDIPIYGISENSAIFMEITYVETLVSPKRACGMQKYGLPI
ncbi:hypothetical protein LguiA_016664 [Lonicera macranthoides]